MLKAVTFHEFETPVHLYISFMSVFGNYPRSHTKKWGTYNQIRSWQCLSFFGPWNSACLAAGACALFVPFNREKGKCCTMWAVPVSDIIQHLLNQVLCSESWNVINSFKKIKLCLVVNLIIMLKASVLKSILLSVPYRGLPAGFCSSQSSCPWQKNVYFLRQADRIG